MTLSKPKIVLVTGATRGLGLAIAEKLSGSGYHIVAAGRKLSPPLKALMARASSPHQVTFTQLDLSRYDQLHDVVARITTEVGPLYGLVNNAAVAHDGILATQHDSEIASQINVNLLGTILLTKYALRPMLLQRRGRIINIASIIGFTGFRGLSVYAATKAGLQGFSRALAREVGPVAITVNTVSPGYMETDMSAGLQPDQLASIRRRSPLGRLASVNEVAAAVSFLLSDEAAAITGTNLTVDAGSTA